MASLVKMSEEAGIQFFGPDNLAIWRVRLIVVATSGFFSMVLMNESGNFEKRFYPDTKYQQVRLLHGHNYLKCQIKVKLKRLKSQELVVTPTKEH